MVPMRGFETRIRWFQVMAVVAVLAIVATACGADDEPVATTTAAAGTTAAPAAAEPGDVVELNVTGVDEAILGNGGIGPSVQQPLDIGRDIIFRADLTVAVDDVATAGEQARAAIASVGGFLFGQQTTGVPRPRSVLTFKVPPANFEEALGLLGTIGEVRSQNVSADDVTEAIVDLESRIATAQASVERLRTLLAGVGTVEDIAKLERELLDRETSLETLRGSLRTLGDAVSLATILITLTEAEVDPKVQLGLTAYPGDEDGGFSCPSDGSIRVEEGARATLCFEIINAGEVGLTDIELSDTVLGLDLSDFIVVFGDPNSVLQPGQNVILAYATTIERDLRTQTRVSATAANADGEPIPSRTVARTKSMTIDTVDPGGLPGFGDGLSASWTVLTGIWGLIVVIAGSLVPFLWLVALVWLAVAWRRRHPPREPAAAPIPSAVEPQPEVEGDGDEQQEEAADEGLDDGV